MLSDVERKLTCSCAVEFVTAVFAVNNTITHWRLWQADLVGTHMVTFTSWKQTHICFNYQHPYKHMPALQGWQSTHHRRPLHCCLHSCSGSHTGCFEAYTGRSHTSLHLACRMLYVLQICANMHTEIHTNLSVTQRSCLWNWMLRIETCVGQVRSPFVSTIVS